MRNTRFSARRVALYGVVTAMALVLGYVEHLVPFPVGIYGVKLGLANLATLTVLYLFGGTSALCVNFVRIILSSLLFGNAFSLSYSLCGGMLSALVMWGLKQTGKLGVTGVSVCGGITHNIAQLAVAAVLVDNLKIAFYLPVLLAAGAVTGFCIGIVVLPMIRNKHIVGLCKTK